MKEGVQVRDSVNVIQVVICLQLCVQRLEQAHKGTLQLLDGAQAIMCDVRADWQTRHGWVAVEAANLQRYLYSEARGRDPSIQAQLREYIVDLTLDTVHAV